MLKTRMNYFNHSVYTKARGCVFARIVLPEASDFLIIVLTCFKGLLLKGTYYMPNQSRVKDFICTFRCGIKQAVFPNAAENQVYAYIDLK